MNSHEDDLIEACLAGRLDAFGELIAPYQDRLFNTFYRLLGSADDASEMLQEAMVRAFRGLKSYQGESSFYTWLYRIAINVALTSRRRQKLRVIHGQADNGQKSLRVEELADSASPSDQIEQRERQSLIEEALTQIPANYRIVLVLKDMDDLKYEQIARILDIPVGTVRSRLHRARMEMRDRLKPMMEAGLL